VDAFLASASELREALTWSHPPPPIWDLRRGFWFSFPEGDGMWHWQFPATARNKTLLFSSPSFLSVPIFPSFSDPLPHNLHIQTHPTAVTVHWFVKIIVFTWRRAQSTSTNRRTYLYGCTVTARGRSDGINKIQKLVPIPVAAPSTAGMVLDSWSTWSVGSIPASSICDAFPPFCVVLCDEPILHPRNPTKVSKTIRSFRS
jgi:hypothetical protein